MEEEKKLIEKAKKGQNEAFAQLYDKYVERIFRFIYLKTFHKADSEDLTQQVFLKAFQNIKKYSYQGFPFSSWLYKIALNVVIDYYRQNKSEEIKVSDLLFELKEEGNLNPWEKFDYGLEIEKVKQIIKKLPQDQQDVLILKFVNDLNNKEIAEILNKSEGAIRVIQHRALKQLKDYFEKYYESGNRKN